MQESTDDPETKAGGKPGQKLDDDEDRKNPAYIPRKGLFFEHDVRGHAQEEERYRLRARSYSIDVNVLIIMHLRLPACLLSDLKVETESCGKMRVVGNTTGSERRSRRQRAARSSSPSMVTTSEMVAAPGTDSTGSAGPGQCFLHHLLYSGDNVMQSFHEDRCYSALVLRYTTTLVFIL